MIKHDKVKVKTESVDMEDIIIPRSYLQRNRLSDELMRNPDVTYLEKHPLSASQVKHTHLTFGCVTAWQQTAIRFEASKWKIL